MTFARIKITLHITFANNYVKVGTSIEYIYQNIANKILFLYVPIKKSSEYRV